MTKNKTENLVVPVEPAEKTTIVVENKKTKTAVADLTAKDVLNSIGEGFLDPENSVITIAETGEVISAEDLEEIAEAEEPQPVEQAIEVVEVERSPETMKEEASEVVRLGDEFSLVGGVTTEQLEASLRVQTEQRSLINKFISNHLIKDIDYGQIHVISRDKCPEQSKCKKSYHWSKKMLFKPGMEKIFSLFGVTTKLEKDLEVYDMFPNRTGFCAFKCLVYRGDKLVAEGRGSAEATGSRDPNAAVKIAEKRARMDACLAMGFSEFFSQDLDDPDYKSGMQLANEKARLEAEEQDKDEFGLLPRKGNLPIDNEERKALMRVLGKHGFTESFDIVRLLTANGIYEPKNMTSEQARKFMGALEHTKFELVITEPVKEEESEEPESEEERPVQVEADLVVDQDLKNDVALSWLNLNLNSYGEKWFMKYAFGTPLRKFNDQFTDAEWRKIYYVIEDINAGKIEVASHCKADS